MTDTEPRMPAQAESSEPAQHHDVFVSYSRADREAVVGLVSGLDARGLKAWVDLEDIPPSAEWMAEIRAAIEVSDGYLVVISPSLASSQVCAEELELARDAGKRIVPVMVRSTDPGSVPSSLAALNWIDATDGAFDHAVDRVVDALRTDLDHVRAHTKLGVRAAEWERKDDSKALLLRGAEIAEAEAIVASGSEPRATPAQARYVQASRSAATRRQRGAIGAVAAALVVSLALSAFALVQRSKAVRQQEVAERQTRLARDQTMVANSRALAAKSLSLGRSQPAVGALLALEAGRTAETPEATQAMHTLSQRWLGIRGADRIHTGSASVVAIDPVSGVVASGSDDDTISIFDPSVNQTIGEPLRYGDDVLGLDFSPDGDLLAAGGKDGATLLWETETWERISEPIPEHEKRWTYDLEFSPDGSSIATASTGNEVLLWDLERHEELARVPGWTVAYDPSGTRVATAVGYSVRIWDVASGERVGEILRGHRSWVQGIEFSPDGRHIASASLDTTVRIWNAKTGKPVGQPLEHPTMVWRVEFSSDGGMLATASDDDLVRIWDVSTGELRAAPLKGHTDSVFDVAFDPNDDFLASSSHDGTVLLWDTGHLPLLGHQGGVYQRGVEDLAVSPDGKLLASAGADGTIRLWNPTTGRETGKPLVGHDGTVWSVSFSSDGERLVSGGRDGTIRLWDVGTRRQAGAAISGHKDDVRSVALSPDDRLIASGGRDRTVRLWDAATREQIGEPLTDEMGHVYAIAFDPSGTLLASASDDSNVRVWRVVDHELAYPPLEGHSDLVYSVAFDRSGEILVSGSKDGSILRWDVGSGQLIGEPLEQTGGVTSLAFGPNAVIASASHLQTIGLWTPEGASIGEPIRGHEAGVTVVEFAPDGRWLASGDANGSIFLWPSLAWSSDRSALEEHLCAVAGRNLTTDEWAELVPFAPYNETCGG